MGAASARELKRTRRHLHVRKKVAGGPDRPRLVVHRSHLHLVAQIVEDTAGRTLLTCSTRHPDFQKKFSKKGGNVEAAKHLGEMVAQSAIASGIKKVVFDRGGYAYHGRVKALADSARAKGLEL